MIQLFADGLASRFKPCLNRVSIAIFLVVTFGGLNGSEADVTTIAKVELATADFALTPDEKFSIVVCSDEKDWPRPTNSSQPRKLPTELFLFDAESGEAVGKKSIANGVVDHRIRLLIKTLARSTDGLGAFPSRSRLCMLQQERCCW